MQIAGDAPFFFVYITALAGCELLVGAALIWRARAESSRRIALLAAAYAWSLPLAITNFISIPGIPPDLNPPVQAAPLTWMLWQLGWVIILAIYASISEGRSRTSARFIPAACATGLLCSILAFLGRPALPALIDDAGRFTVAFDGGIVATLLLNVLVFVRIIRNRPGVRDIWIAAAVFFAALEAADMFASGMRFAALFFGAYAAGLASVVAMLFGVALDALAVVRQGMTAIAERDRLTEFRGIAEAMPQIVWRLDDAGRNVYMNERWTEYTGRIRTDARDESFLDAIHPDDLGERDLNFRQAAFARVPFETTSRIRAADGTYRTFLIRGMPIYDDRTFTGWVGTNTDIDERAQREEQQQAAFESEAQHTDRLRLIAAIGRELSSSLELPVVYEAAVRGPVPAFADWCLLNIRRESGEFIVAAAYHRNPEHAAALRSAIGEPFVISSPVGRTARAYTVTETLVRATIAPPWLDLVRALEPQSTIVAPLVSAGRVRGTLVFVRTKAGQLYTNDDVELAEEIGRRVALTMDNAHLYDRERRVADRLQQATLPSALPQLPGVRLDAVYQAGRPEAQIGGDWFDAFESTDGRLIFGVGDVMGSGLEAAVIMGMVRQAIRGAAEVTADPVAILDAVDRALMKNQRDRIVTAFLGSFDPRTHELVYASAGHPPPYLRLPGGRITRLSGGGIPLGLRTDYAIHEMTQTIAIPDDALLVLYTDGLTEAERNVDIGEAKLLRVLQRDLPETGLARAILVGVLGESAVAHLSDDVAILTIRMSRSHEPRRHVYGEVAPGEAPRHTIESTIGMRSGSTKP